jgi:hypothetical protein
MPMMPKVKRQEAPQSAKKATRAVPAFKTLTEPAGNSNAPTEQSPDFWASGIDYAAVSAPKPMASDASSFEDRMAVLEMIDD